ncbi:SNARE domain-containing protein [Cryptosporidium muris RN66]|uniref:SNARE domain-containing protein n=1 Tax=Cryptosporidium muris (strain RN66) TaxID=441375 RepID=B6A9Z1_CRYMR|nr:SNARE domain-containing protein [Cryptosporidium muris RN66]EEA05032.1 SNARE domain-containing protein [Cryptosporidium muris RN66]|eukprot:XP_002139381.1 SNARE domain-containing protein [Cryptosporidium muris RN66]
MLVESNRDLTNIYIKLRHEHRRRLDRFGLGVPGESRSEKSKENGRYIDVEMKETLPPLWTDLVNEAQEEVTKIKELLSQLQKLHQKRLICILEDDAALSLGIDIESLSSTIYSSFKFTEYLIHQISAKESKNIHTSRGDVRESIIRTNAENSIATQLQPLGQQFRRIQRYYLDQLSKRTIPLTENLESVNLNSTFELNSVSEATINNQIQRTSTIEETAKITQSIAQLNAMFKEMAYLVIEQGSLVDRIDYNVELSLQKTEHAYRRVLKAEEHYRKGGMAKITYFLLVCILIEMSLLIIKKIF